MECCGCFEVYTCRADSGVDGIDATRICRVRLAAKRQLVASLRLAGSILQTPVEGAVVLAVEAVVERYRIGCRERYPDDVTDIHRRPIGFWQVDGVNTARPAGDGHRADQHERSLVRRWPPDLWIILALEHLLNFYFILLDGIRATQSRHHSHRRSYGHHRK